MNENMVKKISLVLSISGLIFLFYVTSNMQPQNYVKLSEIDRNYIGLTVNVKGFVDDFNFNNGHLFLTLKDETGQLKVVIWNETMNYLGDSFKNKIERGVIIVMKGKISEYGNEVEIIPDKNEIKIKNED